MTNNHIEKLVADSVLNNPIEITVGGKKMLISKPTIATLISASQWIAKLPEIPNPATNDEATNIALCYAKDCAVIGEIAAILILGHKGMKKEWKIFDWTIRSWDNVKPLAKKLLDEFSAKELYNLITASLGEQNLDFFLNIIISLSKVNLIKATKIKTTVSGQ
ncbi:MAG: hypothetical protein R3Y50_06035 [Rikenellaceae bacterium]